MPTGHLRSYIEHYFAPHPSQQVRELFVSRAILDFATGAVMLFEPIYLWSVGFTIPQVLLFYGVLYVAYFFMLPLGGGICRRHGYEHTILYSSPFLIMWYLSFFAIPLHSAFIYVALASLVIQKILFWPGYHANFATYSGKGEGGREISNMAAIAGLAAVLAPAFGGIVASLAGLRTLFVIVAVLILLSNIPLLRTPEFFMPQSFSYRAAMRRIFRRENFRQVLARVGFGEELVALVAWPIFIAMVIPNYASLGAVISLAMLVNVAATLYVGRMSDEGQRGAVLKSGTLYSVASWILRPLAAGGLGVFLMDSFYRVAKNMVNVPLVATVYDDAKNGDVMDAVIFFEMALAIGKAAAAFICAAILWFFPTAWTAVFVVAAAFTALYSLLRQAQRA